MNDSVDQLRIELEAAHRTVAELRAQLAERENRKQQSADELDENRDVMLFMREDLESAHKQIEQGHLQWVTALDAIENPIFLHDKQFRILRANRAYQQCAGIPFKEIIGKPYFEVFPKLNGPLAGCLHALEKGEWASDEIVQGDRIYSGRSSPVYDEQGTYLLSVHSLEDVTERKQAEAQMRLFRTLLDNSSDAIEVLDPVTLRFLDINETACRDWGYSREELLSMCVADLDPTFGEDLREKITAQIRQAGYARFEGMRRRKDGSTFPVEISLKALELDKPFLVDIVRDITERKQHELAMQRANRALRTISAGNQVLIHAHDEVQLLQEMCDVAVQVGGYQMAWIGYARDDADKTVQQMAQACLKTHCPMLRPLTWDETKREICPAGRAIISGERRVVQDISSSSEANPWRENVMQCGFASYIALPLFEGERAFGALVLFDDKANVFDADEVSLLEEMAGDLAFGILTTRVKKSHREHEQRLQSIMLQTVKAIAGIVEMRDPYTSGHQARVAEVAREISRQMDLPEDQVQAIYLAGLLHDLGKISIPAEILSKPGRLNEVEYSLIQMHPQSGFDILKGVDFPWPIAQMVLQHHERMDGSGYPQGLKGEEILMGARILSVADVVEAMSSHRPYRPGLGLDAALEEIIRKRGIHYDAQVIDACVALFKEQNYVIPK
ncbi:MAG: PAS domain S-box protein [Sideroxydans sp.]|nr:PAS domain S-box protein [Sideroxydans sp.]